MKYRNCVQNVGHIVVIIIVHSRSLITIFFHYILKKYGAQIKGPHIKNRKPARQAMCRFPVFEQRFVL